MVAVVMEVMGIRVKTVIQQHDDQKVSGGTADKKQIDVFQQKLRPYGEQ